MRASDPVRMRFFADPGEGIAVGLEEFEDLADILRTEPLHIGDDTTSPAFLKEVRWNRAHYRLAEGF